MASIIDTRSRAQRTQTGIYEKAHFAGRNRSDQRFDHVVFHPRESAARLQEQNQLQQLQLAQLTVENERLSKSVPQPSTGPGTEDHQLSELLRLRNEVSTLRRLTNAPKLLNYARV